MKSARPVLTDVLVAIAACRICVDRSEGAPLPHAPRPVLQASVTSRILIAGQAPGRRVHMSGRPFTDPSGDRLREWLGLDAGTFYDSSRIAICPMGFCFPGHDAKGGDRPPRRECAPAWRSQITAALPVLRLVVCLGAYAMAWHMRAAYGGNVDFAVRNWRAALQLDPPVIPLPHPSWRNAAWLNRNPWFLTDVIPVLRRRVSELL